MALREVLDGLQRELGREAQLRHTPPQPGDLPDTLADLGRVGDRVGYVAEVPFSRGLHLYCRWLKTPAS